MGAFGIGERNERGDCLNEFEEEHNLILANTLSHKAKNRHWTWESPDGETRNQTDFALCKQRGIVAKGEPITMDDVGSDHRLVGMTVGMKKRLARLNAIKKTTHLSNINTQKLKGMKERFYINLKNRFEKKIDEVTASKFQ